MLRTTCERAQARQISLGPLYSFDRKEAVQPFRTRDDFFGERSALSSAKHSTTLRGQGMSEFCE